MKWTVSQKQVMLRQYCVMLHVFVVCLEILHFDWLVNWPGLEGELECFLYT